MKLYIGHSSNFDYISELYEPLKGSQLWIDHSIHLPHDYLAEPSYTKDIITGSDLFIAEVSHASTGLGIELGWAHAAKIPILGIHRQDCSPSSALRLIITRFIQYTVVNDIPKLIHQELAYS